MVAAAQEPVRSVFVNRAVSVIDDVEGVIELYAFIWGSSDQRDSYGTYFSKEKPPSYSYKGDLRGREISYEHGQDKSIGKPPIGETLSGSFDDIGLKLQARLDKSSPYFNRIISELRAGELFSSSGSLSHLAEFDDEGRFVTWPIGEVALTKRPAEKFIPAASLIRSDNEQSRDAVGSDGATVHTHEDTTMTTQTEAPAVENDATRMGEMGGDASAAVQQLVAQYGLAAVQAALAQMGQGQQPPPQNPAAQPQSMMSAPDARSIDLEQLEEILETNALNAQLEAMRTEMQALKDEQARDKAERIAAEQAAAAALPAEQPATRRAPDVGNVSVSEPRKFAGRTLQELMFVHQSLRGDRQQPSAEFMQVLAGRAAENVQRENGLLNNPAVRSYMPSSVRADEIMTSTASAGGDEWVSVGYSESLWEVARHNRVWEELVRRGMRVEEVADGQESVVIFLEGSDPTVYTISQSADEDATDRPTVIVPASRPTTARTTLTPGALGCRVIFTDIFEEDSLIRVAPQLNRQMQEKMQETIEQLMINGDTASSANVNLDGGTANSAQYFLASNGFRKYAIVTGSTTYKRDAGVLTDDDYRLTLALFPTTIQPRIDRMVFLLDPGTYNTTLGLSSIKTDDVRRMGATLTSGGVAQMFGVDVMVSGFLPLADSDGKVTSGGNVANTGTILGVYAPYWAMAWKRRVRFETQRHVSAQATEIVGTMRLGFVERGAGAAVASYNITIA
jgi:hypothetical protein